MVKIFLDGTDYPAMAKYEPLVSGFTTNPTLMKKANTTNYHGFAAGALNIANGKPISFEVLSDDIEEMETQAWEIASWGDNIYIKIPVTTTTGESTLPLMRKLGLGGIKINATAVFTFEQIDAVARSLVYTSILSIFCGRIADTGRDPIPFITNALRVKNTATQILWASTRELYNIVQAQQAGCDIITVSPEILSKRDLFGKDLAQYSLETVKQFQKDSEGIVL